MRPHFVVYRTGSARDRKKLYVYWPYHYNRSLYYIMWHHHFHIGIGIELSGPVRRQKEKADGKG